MNYAKIIKNDIANGDGVRTSVFVSGCRNHCSECFNKELWDFGYGTLYTQDTENEILDSLFKPYISGLSLLGGDPMEPENESALLSLCKRAKQECPDKTIWCYTGYTYEQISARDLLQYIDVLVDGKYIAALHDISLVFRGSSNQRIIDVQKSLHQGTVVQKDYTHGKI